MARPAMFSATRRRAASVAPPSVLGLFLVIVLHEREQSTGEGGVAERLIVPVLRAGVSATGPQVQILPPPPSTQETVTPIQRPK